MKKLIALPAVVVVALAAGCDFILIIIALLFLGPIYPGRPQPPPPPPSCPLIIPEQSALPELPSDLRRDTFTAVCDVPERPMLSRQNRDELARSLQALTGNDAELRETLPPDTTGGGLDTIAALHSVSPLLIEQLERAAHSAIAAGMRRRGEVPEVTRHEAEDAFGGNDDGQGFVRVTGNVLTMPVFMPLAGTWEVRVRLTPILLGDEAPTVFINLDGTELNRTTLSTSTVTIVQVRTTVTANAAGAVQPVRRIEVGIRNPFERDGERRGFDVDFVEIAGPFDPPSLGEPSAVRQRLLPCDIARDGDDCAKSALSHFAHLAWRGQRTADDEARLHALYDSERAFDDEETALRTSMSAVLLSPRFLFRVERDPIVTDDLVTDGVRYLNDQELAARLAAYLWSSAPDDRLLELAHAGALRDERVLMAEARRMLDDPRSTALIERFFAMWLDLPALDHAQPDTGRFPDFDEDLRTSLRCEAELLVDRVFREGGTLDDLLLTEQRHLNHKTAAHYGLPPPNLDDSRGGYVLTDMSGLHRPGLLTSGAVLTMTSQPTRTSPTKRGAWVLERIMCLTPPPPPPGVEGLVEVEPQNQQESVRAQLEAHRQNPECAACHSFIDPMGLPLERYDAVGRRRGSDAAFAIDDSALWFGLEGEEMRGAHDLVTRIADDEQPEACLAQRALSYGTGVLVDEDTCEAFETATRAQQNGGKLSDVILEVVKSPAFRARRLLTVDIAEPTE